MHANHIDEALGDDYDSEYSLLYQAAVNARESPVADAIVNKWLSLPPDRRDETDRLLAVYYLAFRWPEKALAFHVATCLFIDRAQHALTEHPDWQAPEGDGVSESYRAVQLGYCAVQVIRRAAACGVSMPCASLAEELLTRLDEPALRTLSFRMFR